MQRIELNSATELKFKGRTHPGILFTLILVNQIKIKNERVCNLVGHSLQ